jgi:hypothetical protein
MILAGFGIVLIPTLVALLLFALVGFRATFLSSWPGQFDRVCGVLIVMLLLGNWAWYEYLEPLGPF